MDRPVKRDQEYIKKQNKNMIFNVIRSKRPISRADIAKIVDMSPTSVGRIVNELTETGLIKESEYASSKVGRKAILLDIDAKSVLNIGVYLNRDIYKIGIVDFNSNILFYKSISFNAINVSPDNVIEQLANSIKEIIKESKVDVSKINGIGIGMPGIIDFKKGKVIISAQLGWKDINVAEKLRKLLKIKVTVDNTVKLKALAESLYGSAINSRKTALISFGSGVGSALVIDGEIYRGEQNIAGEIGHTTVEPTGMLCECGRRGCLQTYIAEAALIQEANKVSHVESLKDIFEAYKNGSEWAINMLDMTTTYIAIAINNMVCMYSPDTVILSGRLIDSYPIMANMIDKKLDKYIWEPFRGKFNLVYSKLRRDAVIIGAASLALKTYLSLD